MRKVPAYPCTFLVSLKGCSFITRVRIAEPDPIMGVVQDRLYERPTLPVSPEQGPSEWRELLGVTVAATHQVLQRVIRKLRDGMLIRVDRQFFGGAVMGHDKTVPDGKPPWGRDEPGASVAETVEVLCEAGFWGQGEGFRLDQIDRLLGPDVNGQNHRRIIQAIIGKVVAALDQHEGLVAVCSHRGGVGTIKKHGRSVRKGALAKIAARPL